MPNKFLVWVDQDNIGNVLTQDAFSNSDDRKLGFKSGTAAISKHVNTGLRQANLVVAALMNVIAPDSERDLTSTLDQMIDEISNHFPFNLPIRLGSGAYSIMQKNASNNNIASGASSIALGSNCKATSTYSLAGGNLSESTGLYSFVYGNTCKSTSAYSFVYGLNNMCSSTDVFATVLGSNNNIYSGIEESSITIIGDFNICAIPNATLIGTGINAQAYKSHEKQVVVFGQYPVVNGDTVFAVGDGDSSASKHNIIESTSEGITKIDSRLKISQIAQADDEALRRGDLYVHNVRFKYSSIYVCMSFLSTSSSALPDFQLNNEGLLRTATFSTDVHNHEVIIANVYYRELPVANKGLRIHLNTLNVSTWSYSDEPLTVSVGTDAKYYIYRLSDYSLVYSK